MGMGMISGREDRDNGWKRGPGTREGEMERTGRKIGGRTNEGDGNERVEEGVRDKKRVGLKRSQSQKGRGTRDGVRG